jgi:hypothetical protein
MVGNEVLQEIEPEQRKLGKDLPFMRDPTRENVIKSRDAVGGDKEQLTVQAINVSHLSAGVQWERREVGVQQRRVFGWSG